MKIIVFASLVAIPLAIARADPSLSEIEKQWELNRTAIPALPVAVFLVGDQKIDVGTGKDGFLELLRNASKYSGESVEVLIPVAFDPVLQPKGWAPVQKPTLSSFFGPTLIEVIESESISVSFQFVDFLPKKPLR